MKKFRRIETGIEGLLIIEPKVIEDSRGFFMESYNRKDFMEIGIEKEFIQDNHSKSQKGVLRGLHFQKEFPQGKLVRVTKGAVLDVAVDLRKESVTLGVYYGIELSEKNRRMFYIPEGFAHGFLTLEAGTEFQYKCTDYYNPVDEDGIMWDDETLDIKWKLEKYGICKESLILSDKDKKQQSFQKFLEKRS